MIKRTIYIENPAYLSLVNSNMSVKLLPKSADDADTVRVMPIEDLGFVIIDCAQVTLSAPLIDALTANNTVVIICDRRHIPSSMTLPLEGHTLQSERFRSQINSSLPLKKQLWRQTVMAKISNQAAVLEKVKGVEAPNMRAWASKVRSNDSTNLEARAAAYYWRNLFDDVVDFSRDRFGDYPNNFFNYGYAILRGVMARALVGKGLLPLLGIHHHNRYNSYCLADDIMEPYRPVVDAHVLSVIARLGNNADQLTTEAKRELLQIPTLDVIIDGHRSPLMIAAETTAASLMKCFDGKAKHLIYPQL